jgi:O-antigen/teichoic acid export membrane protein
MFKKILNTFGTRLFSAVLNLLIAVLISRFLGPEGKGQQGLIITAIAYILVFANLMGGGAIVYLTPRMHYAAILLPAYLWSVVMGMAFFFVLHSFELVNPDFIRDVCILSIINAFTSVNSTLLIGKEKIAKSNLVAVAQPFVIAVVLLYFRFIADHFTIQSYITALYASFGFSFVLSLFLLLKNVERFRMQPTAAYRHAIEKMLHYGALNQLAHIFQLLSFRMSFFYLEKLYSTAEVGIYSNATTLVESIWLISRSISLVQYARIANTNDRNYSRKITQQLTLAGLAAGILGLSFLILLPSEIWVMIYGAGFSEVGSVIFTLAPGVLFFNIALIMGHYFSGIGKYQVNTVASLAGLIIAAILFSFMIPAYGIYGAGWATSISYIITAFIVLCWFCLERPVKN